MQDQHSTTFRPPGGGPLMWQHYNWALAQQSVKGTTKFALACIAQHANEDLKCWIGLDLLAFELSMDVRNAKRAVKALETEKLVRVAWRRRDDGSQQSNLYELLIPADELPKVMAPNYNPYREARPARLAQRREAERQAEARRRENDHY